MIKRKEKYETPNFIFYLTEYEEGSHYQYDIIFSSQYVSPSVSKEELEHFSDFIKKFVEKK
jgi:hypothetical protein